MGNDKSPIFEISQNVIMPKLGRIIVSPDPKYGKPSEWTDQQQFVDAVSNGEIHPLDAKMAVADALFQVLEPISQHFSDKQELIESINSISGES